MVPARRPARADPLAGRGVEPPRDRDAFAKIGEDSTQDSLSRRADHRCRPFRIEAGQHARPHADRAVDQHRIDVAGTRLKKDMRAGVAGDGIAERAFSDQHDVGAFAGFEESCRAAGAQPENVSLQTRFPPGISAVIPAKSEYARRNAGRLEIRAW